MCGSDGARCLSGTRQAQRRQEKMETAKAAAAEIDWTAVDFEQLEAVSGAGRGAPQQKQRKRVVM